MKLKDSYDTSCYKISFSFFGLFTFHKQCYHIFEPNFCKRPEYELPLNEDIKLLKDLSVSQVTYI